MRVFDLIGGTSTGGLSAIMLGRLEMSVDECIDAYSDLTAAVFAEKRHRFPVNFRGGVQSRFNSAKPEGAIRKAIRRSGASETDLFNDGTERGCRTFVCTIDRNTKDMVRLRSYKLPEEPNIRTTICEAALATSAATTFFDPVTIGNRTFADGGFGANNPVDEVEGEAGNIWCSDTDDLKPLVKCFVSIGTGDPGKKPFKDSMYKFLGETIVQIATETQETEKKFIARWAKHYGDKRYFRFNVEQGLQDIGLEEYTQKGVIESATESYLTHVRQKFQVRDCIQNLRLKHNRTGTSFGIVLEEYKDRCIIPTQTTNKKPLWNVPFAIKGRFVGQSSYLNRLEQNLFTQHQPPKVAITGLGGVGKTQIALELAYRTRAKHPNCSVLWIPAVNIESLLSAFVDIGQQFGVPGIKEKNADVEKLMQHYLSQDSAGQWLLIVDNVDDMNMWKNELKSYIPTSQRGCVVCTTRDEKVAVMIAGVNVIEVGKMEEEMAMQLLAKSLNDQDLMASRQNASKLLKEVTFLPLAIVQAAAYIIQNGLTLSQYDLLLGEQEEDVIDLLSEDFDDDRRYNSVKNPVATTWLISFEHIRQIDPLAADYLAFMSCINPKDIPQSLLPPGLSRKKEFDAIGTLKAYSFISKRAIDGAFEVHRLVHLSTRNWLRKNNEWLVWTDRTLERLLEVIPKGDHEMKKVWKAYLPHTQYILSSTAEEHTYGPRTRLVDKMAQCLMTEGRYKEASKAFSLVLGTLQQASGNDHSDTLNVMRDLALAYKDDGRWKDAEILLLRAMDLRIRVRGEDHPDLLVIRTDLAVVYSKQGRWDEAKQLQVQVLATRRRTLGKDHPDTLTSMNNLASTYMRQGRWDEAKQLQVQVLATRQRMLGEDHPSTLTSMSNLAMTYWEQKKLEEAEKLLVRVLEREKRVLGAEHPDHLISMNNVALMYSRQSRQREAEELQVQVIEAAKRLLGEEHPDMLGYIDVLAWIRGDQER